jgi:hypothetical protein
MTISHPPVLKLEDHCSALSKLLHSLAYQELASVVESGEVYEWGQPAEWLDVAASVTKVDVLTGQGDMTLAECESALEYENDRSALLSQFVTSLTIFSFVWGAFESVAKILSPSSIPKEERKDGNDSLTARVAYALKAVKPDGVYYCRLAKLRHRLTYHPAYCSCIPADLGIVTSADAGQGIDLVRRIRNKFAHGAASLPQRDWNGCDSPDNQIVRYSCRLVLLAIQMMLRLFYKDRSFDIDWYELDSDTDAREIHSLLETIHLSGEPTPE